MTEPISDKELERARRADCECFGCRTIARLDAQSQEIERLRGALLTIRDMGFDGPQRRVARAALEPTNE